MSAGKKYYNSKQLDCCLEIQDKGSFYIIVAHTA